MVGLWKNASRLALLCEPDDIQLGEYLECFTAGYKRGVADVRKGIWQAEWSPLLHETCMRLTINRSVVEAGCWCAGVHHGRVDEMVGIKPDELHLQQRFCDSWETAYIADCVMKCNPAALKFGKVLKALCQLRKIPLISDRLTDAILTRQQLT